MSIESTQRNATRNQSTADFQRKNIFTFGNRYSEAVFLNNSGANLTVEAGILVMRNTAAVSNKTVLVPVTADTLAKTVGILNVDGSVEMINAEEINCNLCISGDIDASLLSLPATVTLNTVVGDKLLKDVLTDLGFVLNNVTENSNFDN
jgi:hypothetical protein